MMDMVNLYNFVSVSRVTGIREIYPRCAIGLNVKLMAFFTDIIALGSLIALFRTQNLILRELLFLI